MRQNFIFTVLLLVSVNSLSSNEFSIYKYTVLVDNQPHDDITVNITSQVPSGVSGFHLQAEPALNFETWDIPNINIQAYGESSKLLNAPEKKLEYKLNCK